MAFASTKYWSENADIVETEAPPNYMHTAAYAAYLYGEKMGGIGRLLKYSEAHELALDYEWITDTSYWLGTADNGDMVWNTYTLRLFMSEYSWDACAGIRPVVEISKTLLGT